MKAINLTGKGQDVQRRVMEDCIQKMHHVFGIEMRENKKDEKKKGVYYLVNKIKEEARAEDEDDQQHLEWSDKDNAHLGLLYTVLGLIFMSNGVVREDVLFRFLRLLGVYEEDDRAGGPGGSKSILSEGIKELFGDVRQLVFSEWGAKMHYLDVTKIDTADTDTVMHEFRWGFRAEQELDKENVLEVISQMYECDKTAFKEQYDKVQAEKKGGGGDASQEVEPTQGTSS